MRIAVMGAGAVGGYFGGMLAQGGNEVTFIGRGAHLEAMQKNGLRLETPKGLVHVTNARFVGAADAAGPCDFILFAVKAYDIEAAAAPLKPLVDGGATIISVLNGVDHQDRIGAVVGANSVLGGLAFVSGVISEPGVIRYTSPMSALHFGEADGSLSVRALAFRDAGIAAGFGAEALVNIRQAQWEKFVMLATNAAFTSLFRLPCGYIYHDPEIIPLAKKAFEEAAAVARAEGIAMPADIADRALTLHQGFPKTMYASMFHDVNRGKPMELDSLSGYLVRRGRALGVPTPVHEMAYLALKPYMHGTPKPLD